MRLYILLLLSLAACTTSGPKFSSVSPIADKTTIVVYRSQSFIGMAGYFPVDVNGKEECNLSYQAFFVRHYAPGEINITSELWHSPGTSRIGIKGERGKVHYVRISPDSGKAMSGTFGGFAGYLVAEGTSSTGGPFIFTYMKPEEAKKELADLNQDCQ